MLHIDKSIINNQLLSIEDRMKYQWKKSIEVFIDEILEQLERREGLHANSINDDEIFTLSKAIYAFDAISQAKFYSHVIYYESCFSFLLKLSLLKFLNTSNSLQYEQIIYPGISLLNRGILNRISKFEFLKPNHLHNLSFDLDRIDDNRALDQYLQVLLPSLRLLASLLSLQSNNFPDTELHQDSFNFLYEHDGIYIFIFELAQRIFQQFAKESSSINISNDLLSFLIYPLEAINLTASIIRQLSSSPLLMKNKQNKVIIKFISQIVKLIPILCDILKYASNHVIKHAIDHYNKYHQLNHKSNKVIDHHSHDHHHHVIHFNLILQINELESELVSHLLHGIYNIYNNFALETAVIFLPMFNNQSNLSLSILLDIIESLQHRIKYQFQELNKVQLVINDLAGKNNVVNDNIKHRSSDLRQLCAEFNLRGKVIHEYQAYKQLIPRIGIIYKDIHQLLNSIEVSYVLLLNHINIYIYNTSILNKIKDFSLFMMKLRKKFHRLGRIVDIIPNTYHYEHASVLIGLNNTKMLSLNHDSNAANVMKTKAEKKELKVV